MTMSLVEQRRRQRLGNRLRMSPPHVARIKRLYAEGHSAAKIQRAIPGSSYATIAAICSGKSWGWVPAEVLDDTGQPLPVDYEALAGDTPLTNEVIQASYEPPKTEAEIDRMMVDVRRRMGLRPSAAPGADPDRRDVTDPAVRMVLGLRPLRDLPPLPPAEGMAGSSMAGDAPPVDRLPLP